MVSLHWLSRLVIGLYLSKDAAAQFVRPPKSDTFTNVTGYANVAVRYKQVPAGICELNPSVRSYSGYADVAEDQHAFFWFFEARDVDPRTAPLSVWVSGGPGSSSMNGLFKELGPCQIDCSGRPVDRPHSWSRRSNLLFVDQPTHVGFSYSVPAPATIDAETKAVAPLPAWACPPDGNGKKACGTFSLPHANLTANSTANAAPGMWRTLQGFMGAFPQYSRHGVHLVSQSYGGHYAPVFGDYFIKQNGKQIPGAAHIDLRSVLIGNGWYDPIVQYTAYYNYTVLPGSTYDFAMFNASIQEMMHEDLFGPKGCLGRLRECHENNDQKQCEAADRYCVGHIDGFPERYANRNVYDIRQLNPSPFPYGFYKDYLNRADVQEAIGAFTNFTSSSTAVAEAFHTTADVGRSVGSVEALQSLVNHDIAVAMWAGDADAICNWMGGQAVADMVGVAGWADAGFANLTASDGKVHGQVKQLRKYSFTRFYEAGHEVPFYQPLASLEYFERVIGGLDVATGKVDIAGTTTRCDDHHHYYYRTVGTPESTYRQGNATVQWKATPKNATYNVDTHRPGAAWTNNGKGSCSAPRAGASAN
ncbi:hypothetical protein ARSEF4850_005902 [Beauveria asiatica]